MGADSGSTRPTTALCTPQDRRLTHTRTMAVDPRGRDLKRYLEEDPGGPVVMLNLLRFAEGGRDSYAEYAKALD